MRVRSSRGKSHAQYEPFVVTFLQLAAWSISPLQWTQAKNKAVFDVFNPANNEKSTGARATGVSPDGALFSLNSPMVWNLAGRFAARVRSEAGTNPKEQIEQVYLLALSRPPTDEETTIGLELFEGRSDDALVDYCHIILALNEFIYIQ